MKIVIFGLGRVGLPIAVKLAKDNEVLGVDKDRNKVDLINRGLSPIDNAEVEQSLRSGVNLKASTHVLLDQVADADRVIIASSHVERLLKVLSDTKVTAKIEIQRPLLDIEKAMYKQRFPNLTLI